MKSVFFAWFWPALCAAIILIGFAVPNSDRGATPLLLFGLIGIACGILSLIPTDDLSKMKPTSIRYALLMPPLFLIGYLALQPLLIHYFDRSLSIANGQIDPSRASLEALKLCGVACAFLFGMFISTSDSGAKKLLDAIIYAGGAWAAFCIVMHIHDPNGIYGYQKIKGLGRLTGTFSSANSAATLFASVSVMSLGRVLVSISAVSLRKNVESIKLSFVVTWFFSTSALFLTMSRMGIASWAASTIFISIAILYSSIQSSLRFKAWLTAGVIGAVLLMAGPLLTLFIRVQHASIDAATRIEIFSEHYNLIRQHFLFGLGLGSFNTANTTILNERNLQALSDIQSMHNVYLQWLEETGICGLIILTTINICILLEIKNGATKRHSMGSRCWIILSVYLIFLTHGLVDFAFQEPALELFVAVLLGCGVSISLNRQANTIARAT